jgi:Pyridoxamine 5'-phosphate oxidase
LLSPSAQSPSARRDDAVMSRRRPSWEVIAARLAPERSYWLCTVALDGAPHVTPVWGVVVRVVWHFYSERSTVKARNLAADPRVALHLESGEDVLIVRGRVEDLGQPSSRPEVVAAFEAKYTRPADLRYLPLADPAYDVVYALHPESAALWRLDDYERSQQRWRRTTSDPPDVDARHP